MTDQTSVEIETFIAAEVVQLVFPEEKVEPSQRPSQPLSKTSQGSTLTSTGRPMVLEIQAAQQRAKAFRKHPSGKKKKKKISKKLKSGDRFAYSDEDDLEADDHYSSV